MYILGIESSCDETAASLIQVKNNKITVLSNVVSSQIKIHQKYGGVVPELAARNHIKNILPVLDEALSPLAPRERGLGGEGVIAVTAGPGLIPSLIIGLETAKVLSYVWNKPLIGVNHLAGHIYSTWINSNKPPRFPALALIVSGGHTELVLMKDHLKFKVLGQTRDDAAGEAFDKAAKILGLGYPGGPIISKYGEGGNPQIIKLPRPMINSQNLDFSFSGLKTALLYQVRKDKKYKNRIPEYCASFQQAIIDVLISKTIKAAKNYRTRSVALVGGVAANKELRNQLKKTVEKSLPNTTYHLPPLEFTTDNAAMIAVAGYYMAKNKKITPWNKIKVNCNLSL